MSIEISGGKPLAGMFKALGDPIRLRIFQFLRRCDQAVEIDEAGRCRPAGSLSVGEVCCQFGQAMSTVSFHLKELRLAGLVRMERRGRWIYCSVDAAGLANLREFLDERAGPGATCCDELAAGGTPVSDDGGSAPGRRPWQRYLAEFLGTLALVFAGCGAVISDAMSGGRVSHLGIALTFGFVVAVMVYALGPISAAHFNPAVTLGFAVARRFPWRHVPAYLSAQIAGALAAGLLHHVFYGGVAAKARYGATVPAVSAPAAVGFEVVLTFFLMLVIMAVATDRRVSGAVPGLAIGLTVALCAIFGGPVTGASMNPARSLAPALWSGGAALSALPIYLLAPPAGAVLAALGYELLRDGALHAQAAPADLEEALRREPGLSRG